MYFQFKGQWTGLEKLWGGGGWTEVGGGGVGTEVGGGGGEGNDKRVNTMPAKTELIYISIHTDFGYSVRQGTLKVSLGNRSYTLLKKSPE